MRVRVNYVALIPTIASIVGAVLIGLHYDSATLGVAVGLLAFALMPYPPRS